MSGTQTEQTYQINEKKQMLVFVRYMPAGIVGADAMLGGVTSKVDSVASAVENAASSIPGVNLFFKEEEEPGKKVDKEYNYFQDYSEWDKYIKKMKEELANKLNTDNEVVLFEFDADDAEGRKKEGKKLCNEIKSKISAWKDYTACFHFVGLGQGGNVANECIKELCKEADFKKKWWVQSVIYIATPLYKQSHVFDREAALRGKGKIYSFGNAYDLTHYAISYFEPNDKLLKVIAECNSNLLSVFTGKIKTQLVATLGRLLSIDGFGTGHDNKGNIDKLKQCKDDIKSLISECIEAVKTVVNAFPGLVKPPDLPKFGEMLNGMDQIPSKSVQRLEAFIDELKNVREGTSLDTSRINIAKLFNFLCPLVDHLTSMLSLFRFDSETTAQLFDKIVERTGVKKILQPADVQIKTLPVDSYIEKVIERAKEIERKQKESQQSQSPDAIASSAEKIFYDQASVMISTCKDNIAAATKEGDLDLNNKNVTPEIRQKVADVITAMLLPMMPSKEKFYATLLQYIPLGGAQSFLDKISADAAFNPLKSLMGRIKGNFDFDEGTEEEPGLKKSLSRFNEELNRVKGYLNKNNYPIHKDANSLYFIYNGHNIMLKKPYGEILYTIDKETGYLDYMESIGYTNFYNLEKNEYQGSATQKDDVQPVQQLEEKETAA
ncbi:hypothetical protein PIECOFPK_02537 [Mycovorax composti]|uniref:Uncharacterized protein n=1 Tax=Mycovorax composti TaxID=2962693 RepID=A0ABZ2EMJ7_9BACT